MIKQEVEQLEILQSRTVSVSALAVCSKHEHEHQNRALECNLSMSRVLEHYTSGCRQRGQISFSLFVYTLTLENYFYQTTTSSCARTTLKTYQQKNILDARVYNLIKFQQGVFALRVRYKYFSCFVGKYVHLSFFSLLLQQQIVNLHFEQN